MQLGQQFTTNSTVTDKVIIHIILDTLKKTDEHVFISQFFETFS